ncbi:glucose-6-phosphate dehydrogenase [Jannaschia aquimarina]|uniref:Glucose-6-phosphate 1-dehydrogenase n=1 Tax=Jannaschia aquimarina TaxID=935700 RepID=A0A0D1ECY6_9RHOB|nr:glucose-6-phosphate dehydrogenase [Jannaschia aquimarina]KIT14791.1 Glucose-6-phosphate 1-dehydrogenase [Jannaschia aquimarina]SNS85396.1 glucose-6-phosphate 1-dehydrogenase [Jannaschia aquimarina]
MASRTIPVDAFDIVLFGATGDLAKRKIIPSLYRRFLAGQMPAEARLIGAARSDLTDDSFRDLVRESLEEFVSAKIRDADMTAQFCDLCSYIAIDAKGDGGWDALKSSVRDEVTKAFYFSVGPNLFGPLSSQLREKGIACENSRLVVEKPFGHDLDSARKLNADLAASFDEDQIYRIDHFLGKETVQNLMAVRFANVLFEPLWNERFIDHVQVTVAETVGVGGRGSYYDDSGAMRDMVQNHLMQLLCLIAMEPPAAFDPDRLRDEKLKVIRALDPVPPADVVRGQYKAGPEGPSYTEDAENPDSLTESFVALKVGISNWRWKHTPFYLRTGKRMTRRVSEIVVQFKETPHSIFDREGTSAPNALVIRLQPDEGIELAVTIKEPGPGGMRLTTVPLDMTFADALGEDHIPDAYERLIMDVMRGDQTLFMRGDEVEAAWAWTDPIIDRWQEAGDKPHPYAQGSSGPEQALMLMHRDGRRWRDLDA